MPFNSLFDFRSITIFKAFILNCLVLAVVAGMSIELRGYMDDREETKHFSRLRKMMITIVGTMAIGFSLFTIVRVLFGYGGGLLAAPEKYPTFF